MTSSTWKNGFQQSTTLPQEPPAYDPSRRWVNPPSHEYATSTHDNEFGKHFAHLYPTIIDGTQAPEGKPSWWKPTSEVDVIIVGAGPSGLVTAISLVRQGLSVRILDKAKTPLVVGRADALLPRAVETLEALGLSADVTGDGPLINHTAVWVDGKPLTHDRSHQSDSKFKVSANPSLFILRSD